MALYDDLGGAPAIDMALARFYERVMADGQLSPFFVTTNFDSLRKRVGMFFASVAGGPAGYDGPSLRDVHRRFLDRGLDDEVFDRFVGLFEEVLNELGVPDGPRDQVVGYLRGQRSEVLNR